MPLGVRLKSTRRKLPRLFCQTSARRGPEIKNLRRGCTPRWPAGLFQCWRALANPVRRGWHGAGGLAVKFVRSYDRQVASWLGHSENRRRRVCEDARRPETPKKPIVFTASGAARAAQSGHCASVSSHSTTRRRSPLPCRLRQLYCRTVEGGAVAVPAAADGSPQDRSSSLDLARLRPSVSLAAGVAGRGRGRGGRRGGHTLPHRRAAAPVPPRHTHKNTRI